MVARLHDGDDLPEGDGVLILSPEKVILAATLQAERLLRRKLQPGQFLPLEEIFPGPHLAQAEQAFAEAIQSGTLSSQLPAQICAAPDLTLPLKYSTAPLYSKNREISGVVLTFHDDTLTRAGSVLGNFGLGVEPEAVFENLDRGFFIVNDRRRITALTAGPRRSPASGWMRPWAATVGRSFKRTVARRAAPCALPWRTGLPGLIRACAS